MGSSRMWKIWMMPAMSAISVLLDAPVDFEDNNSAQQRNPVKSWTWPRMVQQTTQCHFKAVPPPLNLRTATVRTLLSRRRYMVTGKAGKELQADMEVRQGYYQTARHLPERLPVRGQGRRHMELMNSESQLSMASPSNCGVQPDTREHTLLLKLKSILTGELASLNHTGTMEIWN
jgi:hypothetical protein